MASKYGNIVFTRYLYIFEEVCYSLIFDTLSGLSFKRVIFWLSELYYSGYKDDIWSLAFLLYYDFHAKTNPHLYPFICKKYKLYRKNYTSDTDTSKNEINLILSVFKNIFISKTIEKVNYNVLIVNHIKNTSTSISLETHLYKGRKMAIVSNFVKKHPDKEFKISPEILKILKSLFQSICKNDKSRTYEILHLLFDSLISLYSNKNSVKIILNYILNFYKHYINEDSIADDYMNISNTDCEIYTLDINILYRFICNMIFNMYNREIYKHKSNIKINVMFVKPGIKTYDAFIKTNHIETEYNWKIMREKVEYNLSINITLFDLYRDYFEEKDISDMLYYNWEYYAYRTPLWKKRVKSHKGKLNHNNLSIDYNDEDLMEGFYSKFGLEPDEQPKSIQDCILKLDDDHEMRDNKDLYERLFELDNPDKISYIDSINDEQRHYFIY